MSIVLLTYSIHRFGITEYVDDLLALNDFKMEMRGYRFLAISCIVAFFAIVCKAEEGKST